MSYVPGFSCNSLKTREPFNSDISPSFVVKATCKPSHVLLDPLVPEKARYLLLDPPKHFEDDSSLKDERCASGKIVMYGMPVRTFVMPASLLSICINSRNLHHSSQYEESSDSA